MKLKVSCGLVLLFGIMGCQNSGESTTSGLGSGLEAKGFLVVKEIVPDQAKAGSYLVTCASSSGDQKPVSHTKADIEQNNICLPSKSSEQPAGTGTKTSTATSSSESTGVSSTSTAASIKLERAETYLKSRPDMDVTATGSLSGLGSSFCIVKQSDVSAVSVVCKTAKGEIKAKGFKISGCSLTEGYLYGGHVTPSAAPAACQ